MTSGSENSYFTLQEAVINLGYEWFQKDYFFCHSGN